MKNARSLTEMPRILRLGCLLLPCLLLSSCALLGIGRDDPSPGSDEDTAEFMEREQERIDRASAARDITLGMRQSEVSRAWGSPGYRERAAAQNEAGVPRQLERWVYPEGVMGLGAQRVIYFESGRVIGWETVRR